MRIRRDTWHYRYLRWIAPSDSEMPKNLCEYVFALFGAVAVLPVVALCFSPIWVPFVGLVALGDWMQALYKRGHGPQPTDPSLVGAWLTAKKARVCPLIEYVDVESSRDAIA